MLCSYWTWTITKNLETNIKKSIKEAYTCDHGFITVDYMNLFQDMTSRDLVQQRTTLANGDTTWRLSPLVTAALDGSLAVLDGVHRINAGSFSLLHR